MTISKSLGSYTDCLEIMDRALDDEVGTRVRLPSEAECTFLRMRMNMGRSLHRKKNREIYAETPDHPLFDASPYDQLIFRIRHARGDWFLDIEKQNLSILDITPLSQVVEVINEPPERIELKQVLRIAGPEPTEVSQIKRRV